MRTTSILLLSLAACDPVTANVPQGDYAVSFTGDGCAAYSGDSQDDSDEYLLSGDLTVDAWVQVAKDADQSEMVVMQLGNAATLWVGAVGAGFSPPSDLSQGATTGVDLDDGEVHHLAGTVSPAEGAELFLDGIRVGFGDAWTVVPGTDSVYIGCDSDGANGMRGVIDEVRISDTTRYTTNFVLPDEAYEGDGDTISLYHFDLGLGSAALDEAARFDLTLSEAVTWTDGLLE